MLNKEGSGRMSIEWSGIRRTTATVAILGGILLASDMNTGAQGSAGTPYPGMPQIAPIGTRIAKYLDVPESAKGPAIDPAKGYRIQELGKAMGRLRQLHRSRHGAVGQQPHAEMVAYTGRVRCAYLGPVLRNGTESARRLVAVGRVKSSRQNQLTNSTDTALNRKEQSAGRAKTTSRRRS